MSYYNRPPPTFTMSDMLPALPHAADPSTQSADPPPPEPELPTGTVVLLEYIDRRVQVELVTGEIYLGVLRTFDQFSNLVLTDVQDRILGDIPVQPADPAAPRVRRQIIDSEVLEGAITIHGESLSCISLLSDEIVPGRHAAPAPATTSSATAASAAAAAAAGPTAPAAGGAPGFPAGGPPSPGGGFITFSNSGLRGSTHSRPPAGSSGRRGDRQQQQQQQQQHRGDSGRSNAGGRGRNNGGNHDRPRHSSQSPPQELADFEDAGHQ
ncbi:hypothetical protein H696_00863 [Fonticula alba]|uniref:Sm domain-containing protein n=1 Tax=Fonticula alba TaxID=691883 RepID=A0A058ZIH6_FONAL|nr:hypothetical protein H696_00863 [Fonticula alba]KCV73322.1 hypothetical protein H696_00863 [Fonticula alba]|eukprot:XP_009493023.1 hypothetical protein H696_00863 [Fonticula alba]